MVRPPRVSSGPSSPPIDPEATDPNLLKQHSQVRSFTTNGFTYDGLRVFYRRHPQQDQLPTDPWSPPLLVFIHGLGGSVAQLHPLLSRLKDRASCLAVDLPGCGRSAFAARRWDAYSTDALVKLLDVIVDEYREPDQRLVFIGHSMGSALAARLARGETVAANVIGLVAICPPAEPPPEDKVALYRRLLWIPTFLFDIWRAWDRRGGPNSASVLRFVGEGADADSREMQDRFNNQSRTDVWRRMAWGSLPKVDGQGKQTGGLPGRETWAALKIPVYLVAGEKDNITPPQEVDKILDFMTSDSPSMYDHLGALVLAQKKQLTESISPLEETSDDIQPIVDSAAPVDSAMPPEQHPSPSGRRMGKKSVPTLSNLDEDPNNASSSDETPSTPRGSSSETVDIPPQAVRPQKYVGSVTLRGPSATHALLYMPSTVSELSGLISTFLVAHVSARLDLGWQLRYLSSGGKWDVKNIEKWTKVAPVSEPIAGIFRAMKTLREADGVHTPARFVKSWGGEVGDVVDISHDTPVYDSQGLERGGVRYHKFATVSKIPPRDDEVAHFVALVDKIRAGRRTGAAEAESEGEGRADGAIIGVHCHYGFNRTGYYIVCYLVERCGFKLQDAIRAFATARPNGIRHAHFLDALSLRYMEGNRDVT